MKKLITLIIIITSFLHCDMSSNKTIEIEVVSEPPITFQSNARIKLILWGYDTGWADTPATLLNEYVFPIEETPTKYSLEYLSEWDSKIDPNSGSLLFYVKTYFYIVN